MLKKLTLETGVMITWADVLPVCVRPTSCDRMLCMAFLNRKWELNIYMIASATTEHYTQVKLYLKVVNLLYIIFNKKTGVGILSYSYTNGSD